MNIIDFITKSEDLINSCEDLINELPDQGLTCETSQKLCLLNALSSFHRSLGGLEIGDFETDSRGVGI